MTFEDRYRTRRCEQCGQLFAYCSRQGRSPWKCKACRTGVKGDAGPARPCQGERMGLLSQTRNKSMYVSRRP